MNLRDKYDPNLSFSEEIKLINKSIPIENDISSSPSASISASFSPSPSASISLSPSLELQYVENKTVGMFIRVFIMGVIIFGLIFLGVLKLV